MCVANTVTFSFNSTITDNLSYFISSRIDHSDIVWVNQVLALVLLLVMMILIIYSFYMGELSGTCLVRSTRPG